MTVYVCSEELRGGSVLGVFTTLEAAKARVPAFVADAGDWHDMGDGAWLIVLPAYRYRVQPHELE